MELIRNEKVAVNTVELEFKVGKDVFEPAVTKAFRKANAEITVPGFRKGKAPRKVVEKMYGEEIFFNDAIDAILPDAYAEAVEAAGIAPVARPTVDITECSNEGFTAKVTVVVKPEVTVNEYKGLKATKKAVVVTDEEIEAELNVLRDRNGRLVEVEGRKAELNDTANIDFEGFVDEVAFEGGKGESFDLLLGSGQFIPGFEDQIVGHEVGEEFDVNVTFPEEYHATDLAGKAAVFKTKLNSLKAKELPELDDEFAKDVSEFDTLDELKADIRKAHEERAAAQAELEVENTLVDAVVASMEAVVPEEMVEARIDEQVRDFEGRMAQQGLQLNTYLTYTGMTMEAFRKTFAEQAEQQVKIRLALEKVAELENLTVSEEEVEAELAKIAEAYKMKLEQVKAFIPAVEIKKDIAINKAIDFVKENAEITAE
ncbi:MAG: trigger factor [Firmicutes bacterium]|nr:trigger factor [Bacillota bacterium]